MGKAFTSISTGLHEAIAHAKGEETTVVVHRIGPVVGKAVREKTSTSEVLHSLSSDQDCGKEPEVGDGDDSD